MITELITLPVRVVRGVAALPGRLESMERSMSEMQRLLAAAVGQLSTIEAHTDGMHGQLGRIDDSTTELSTHTQGLGDNTERLVRIAAPLERMGRRRERRAFRRNGAAEDEPPAS
jgi:hypothetical protein